MVHIARAVLVEDTKPGMAVRLATGEEFVIVGGAFSPEGDVVMIYGDGPDDYAELLCGTEIALTN